MDDLKRHLEREYGTESKGDYFVIFEQLRVELGYADCLGAFQRYRIENLCDLGLVAMSSFLIDGPLAERTYPGALDVLQHLQPGYCRRLK